MSYFFGSSHSLSHQIQFVRCSCIFVQTTTFPYSRCSKHEPFGFVEQDFYIQNVRPVVYCLTNSVKALKGLLNHSTIETDSEYLSRLTNVLMCIANAFLCDSQCWAMLLAVSTSHVAVEVKTADCRHTVFTSIGLAVHSQHQIQFH